MLIAVLVGIILILAVMLASVEAQRRREGLHARGGSKADRCVAFLGRVRLFAPFVLQAALNTDWWVLFLLAALLVGCGAIGQLARVQICESPDEILKPGSRWPKDFWFVVVSGLWLAVALPAILGIEALPLAIGLRLAIGAVAGWVVWWLVTAVAALVYSTRPRAVLYCVWKAEIAWPLKAIRCLLSR